MNQKFDLTIQMCLKIHGIKGYNCISQMNSINQLKYIPLILYRSYINDCMHIVDMILNKYNKIKKHKMTKRRNEKKNVKELDQQTIIHVCIALVVYPHVLLH